MIPQDTTTKPSPKAECRKKAECWLSLSGRWGCIPIAFIPKMTATTYDGRVEVDISMLVYDSGGHKRDEALTWSAIEPKFAADTNIPSKMTHRK